MVKITEKQERRFPGVAVDAIIRKENQIVIVQRKYPPHKDEWALPGGFIELGERVEEAVLREMKEETSLDVKIERLFNVYSDPDRDPRGHMITIVYICNILEGSPKIMGGDDAKVAKFIDLGEIKNVNLAFDHEKIITDYLNLKNGKIDDFVAIY